jgi:hypothetical protein
MYRITAIVIGIAFLAYGWLRIGVGSAMLGHELGIFDIDVLQEPGFMRIAVRPQFFRPQFFFDTRGVRSCYR